MSLPDAPAPVRSRRLAREAAFQGLYQIHVAGVEPETAARYAETREPFTPDAAALARSLVMGTAERTEALDGMIEPCLSAGWSLSRLAVTDLLSLRMAAYELESMPLVPPLVTLTEYVSLAKRFGTADSGRFVHGVLGSLLPLSAKADWTPPAPGTAPEVPDDPVTTEPEPEEVTLVEGTAEYDEAMRAGRWVIRAET